MHIPWSIIGRSATSLCLATLSATCTALSAAACCPRGNQNLKHACAQHCRACVLHTNHHGHHLPTCANMHACMHANRNNTTQHRTSRVDCHASPHCPSMTRTETVTALHILTPCYCPTHSDTSHTAPPAKACKAVVASICAADSALSCSVEPSEGYTPTFLHSTQCIQLATHPKPRYRRRHY